MSSIDSEKENFEPEFLKQLNEENSQSCLEELDYEPYDQIMNSLSLSGSSPSVIKTWDSEPLSKLDYEPLLNFNDTDLNVDHYEKILDWTRDRRLRDFLPNSLDKKSETSSDIIKDKYHVFVNFDKLSMYPEGNLNNFEKFDSENNSTSLLEKPDNEMVPIWCIKAHLSRLNSNVINNQDDNFDILEN